MLRVRRVCSLVVALFLVVLGLVWLMYGSVFYASYAILGGVAVLFMPAWAVAIVFSFFAAFVAWKQVMLPPLAAALFLLIAYCIYNRPRW